VVPMMTLMQLVESTNDKAEEAETSKNRILSVNDDVEAEDNSKSFVHSLDSTKTQ